MGVVMHIYNRLLGLEIGKNIQDVIVLVKMHREKMEVAFSVLLVVYFLSVLVKHLRSKFPPGPIGLPVVGYLHFLSKDIHLDFMKLGKKYGDVFSVRLGSVNVVILNGVQAIKEAYVNPHIQGRPPDNPLKMFNEHSAFFLRDNHVWREQRRFVFHSMKDLGLGKSKIEGDIQDEIKCFLDVLRTSNGTKMDVNVLLTASISNNIYALVFGRRYEYDNADRIFLYKNMEIGLGTFTSFSALTFLPWITRIPFVTQFLGWKKAENAFYHINKFFRTEIENHRKTLDSNNVRDFIDRYLVEMKTRQEKDTNTIFDENALLGDVMDLFAAGSDTVRTSILWTIYTMAAYPDIQKKVQKEIMDVIGSERSPEYLDQRRMPYTHAVMLEVMRWKTVAPLGVMKYTTEHTTIGEYHIPQGTIVIGNLWAVHYDPQTWEDPGIFKPERFLNSDGTGVLKPNNFMPFSVGKRSCIGESMANIEVFLYFICILQKFDVAFPEGMKVTFDAKFIAIYKLEPYEVRFIARK